MASSHNTPTRIKPYDYTYPGWNLGWKKPGDKHDPLMDALIRHRVQEMFLDEWNSYVGEYYCHQESERFQGVTLYRALEDKFGTLEERRAEIERRISACSPEDVKSEWMANTYTQYGCEGYVEWVSYVWGLNIFAGWRDFSVLEDASFIVNMEPVLDGNELLLKITIQSPIGTDILPKHKDMPSDETWLYRMFDQEGVLLYIGISQDAFVRFSQHAKDKPWIDQVARWEREAYPTRRVALEAEKAAIKAEFPLYNVVHNERATK